MSKKLKYECTILKDECPTEWVEKCDDCDIYSNSDTKRVVRRLGDYDIWYQKCEHCGYDTGKSTLPKNGENKTCWKCGSYIKRDFSDRALKPA